MLRLVSYLAPSLPEDLFALVASHLGEACGLATELSFERTISGPLPGDADPFAEGRADVGFVCAPSYRWLRPRVELLPVPVPLDPRAAGRPVYHADVVVRVGSAASGFHELANRRWAYNDRNSRSGWFSMLERVAPQAPEAFFASLLHAGSHLESLERVAEGSADAAAIDSNVLRLQRARRPELARELRVLESWGPFAIQPAIVRADLPPELKGRLARALLDMHETRGAELARFGFAGFQAAPASQYTDGSATRATAGADGGGSSA